MELILLTVVDDGSGFDKSFVYSMVVDVLRVDELLVVDVVLHDEIVLHVVVDYVVDTMELVKVVLVLTAMIELKELLIKLVFNL